MLNWYRKLLALRKNSDVLVQGTYRELLPESEELFAFAREHDGREIITIANFTGKSVTLPKDLAKRRVILSSEGEINAKELSPFEARICE